MNLERSAFIKLHYELAAAFQLALDAIRAHKLRSVLTLLGVIIGVASVVVVGAAIEGLGQYAEESTSKTFGTNSYLIARVAIIGQWDIREYLERLRKHKRIRKEDVEFLRATTGQLILYSPFLQRSADISAGGSTYEGASLMGVSSSIEQIRNVDVVDGRFFTAQEEQTSQFVAVIGDEIREQLFPLQSPIGQTIRIRGFSFRVIGVLKRLGSAFGRNLDNDVYIPVTTFARIYGWPESISVFAAPRTGSGLTPEEAIDITRAALRVRYRVPPAEKDPFDIVTPEAIRSFIDRILGMIAAVVIPLTSISLVVGGIVIMNIMLVSVTERTREIGIRKSIGARKSDILLQILLEAVMLASLGGVIGLGVGFVASEILNRTLDLTLKITLPYVLLAVMVSTLVGVASGWYPAKRAATLDPVVALRAE